MKRPIPICAAWLIVLGHRGSVFGGDAQRLPNASFSTAIGRRLRRAMNRSPRRREPYLRAEGDWGLKMYDEANGEFRTAVAQTPGNAMYRVRWGRLLHERFNNSDAEDLFNEALKIDPNNAPAYVGLALVSADGFDDKAVEYDAKAIGLDPEAGGSARTDGQSGA